MEEEPSLEGGIGEILLQSMGAVDCSNFCRYFDLDSVLIHIDFKCSSIGVIDFDCR